MLADAVEATLAARRQAPAFLIAAERADSALPRISVAILGAWAAWLRGFEGSTGAFLLDEFVRRPGAFDPAGPAAFLARRPLDLVLDRAGYLEPLDLPPWLGGGVLDFQFCGSRP
jgi:hypothetical protein